MSRNMVKARLMSGMLTSPDFLFAARRELVVIS
jgi:hypothetical protein